MRYVFSLVLFKHSLSDLRNFLTSFLRLSSFVSPSICELFIYNASPGALYSFSPEELSLNGALQRLHYYEGPNLGYGSANNFNFVRAQISDDDLFIVSNPDISFCPSALYPLLAWVTINPSVACAAPLVVNLVGNVQYSAKLNPTLLSLLLGRFPLLTKIGFFGTYDYLHKHKQYNYHTECIYSPFLSGCFLVIPAFFYRKVNGFDSRYFLHLEDADLVRRLSAVGATVHNPIGKVNHAWARGSHHSLTQMIYLLRSICTYSYIWGIRFF